MKKLLAATLLAAALVSTPVQAQEAGGSTEKAVETGNSGAEKPGMVIWQWINFAILAGVLGWIATKQGGPFFASRAKSISAGLAAGETAKREAEARARSVDARLANLKSEIADIRSRAREEREREADRIRRDTAAEIARIRAHAELELASSAKQARLDVQRFTAKLAIDLAERKIRAQMSSSTHSALLDSFLHDLPDGVARAHSS